MALFKKSKKDKEEKLKVENIDQPMVSEKETGGIKTILPKGKDPKAYSQIKMPRTTEKAVFLKQTRNQYTFEVYPGVNKSEIKKAVERLYEVKVSKVMITKTFGKVRQLGRFTGFKPGVKKAVVVLEKGHKIDILST